MDDIAKLPRPRLEVRDLQVALALATSGSTARAAEQLHLTQPAVSRALQGIEGRLGVQLFERSQRGLVPTAAGERLLSGARELLLGLQDLERRTCTPAPQTRLRVVSECYTAYHWLASALNTLLRAAPGLAVTIAVEHTSEPVTALLAAQIDVALVTTARVPRGGLVEEPLFSDEVVFVLSQRHALAAKTTLSRDDLRTHPLLVSSATPDAEAGWFGRAVFGRRTPRLSLQRLPLTETILEIARNGAGIAVLSEWMAAPYLTRGDLVVRRLNTGALQRPWRAVYRREAEPAVQRLLPILRAAAPHLRPTS